MLLISTTTVSLYRPTSRDPYTAAEPVLVASGIDAQQSNPAGAGVPQQSTVDSLYHLAPDTDVQKQDELVDDVTGRRWEVTWVEARHGFGLDRILVGVNAISGAVSP